MTAAQNLPTIACETGKTGGGLLQAPAAFFRWFTPKPAAQPNVPTPADTMSPSQAWMVTWQSLRGDVQTDTVLISGAWPMERIEHQARIAMHLQHDIPNAHILRLTLDCSR